MASALLSSCAAISSRAAFRPAQRQQQRSAAPLTIRAAQTLQGKVVSTSMDKTAVVAVDVLQVHPVYQKRVRQTTKYAVHDEAGMAQVGDIVILAPSRPLSKTKRFVVESVLKKAQ